MDKPPLANKCAPIQHRVPTCGTLCGNRALNIVFDTVYLRLGTESANGGTLKPERLGVRDDDDHSHQRCLALLGDVEIISLFQRIDDIGTVIGQRNKLSAGELRLAAGGRMKSRLFPMDV